MKNIINQVLFLLLVAVSFTACTKDEAAPTAPTFDAFVKANTNLTLFAAAVEKANLKDFTTGPGPFTWFAPSNAAFTAAGVTQDSLNKLPAGTVSYLLMYHLVNGNYATQDMIAQSSISRTTQGGQAIFNGGFNNTFFVNGGRISSADNAVTNGFVHVSERLLTPPLLRGNIQAMIRSTGQHALFEAALTKANLWAQFATGSIFTVMAPTDAAMNAAGLTSTFIASQSSPAQIAALAAMLRYHYFLNVRLFTNDFISDPTTIATAAGPSTSLTASDNGTKIRGRGNTTPANITVSDRLGTNGLVHVIDAVLVR